MRGWVMIDLSAVPPSAHSGAVLVEDDRTYRYVPRLAGSVGKQQSPAHRPFPPSLSFHEATITPSRVQMVSKHDILYPWNSKSLITLWSTTSSPFFVTRTRPREHSVPLLANSSLLT